MVSVIRNGHIGRILRMPLRLAFALSYYWARLWNLLVWVVRSREGTNLTYNLTRDNLDYMAHAISVVTGCPFAQVRAYIDEAQSDESLRDHVIRYTAASSFRYKSDERCNFGRRLGWYAVVRVMKPKVVIETGVDKGHGAVLLCAALLRNAQEGHPGRYYGTDINPEAGWLLQPPYSSMGRILYGDSIESLKALDETVDLFINDSDHSTDYEYREYQVIAPRLAPGAIILGDNAHVSGKLAQFSRETGREFLFFAEAPENHWYPGAGIGISFRRRLES